MKKDRGIFLGLAIIAAYGFYMKFHAKDMATKNNPNDNGGLADNLGYHNLPADTFSK